MGRSLLRLTGDESVGRVTGLDRRVQMDEPLIIQERGHVRGQVMVHRSSNGEFNLGNRGVGREEVICRTKSNHQTIGAKPTISLLTPGLIGVASRKPASWSDNLIPTKKPKHQTKKRRRTGSSVRWLRACVLGRGKTRRGYGRP